MAPVMAQLMMIFDMVFPTSRTGAVCTGADATPTRHWKPARAACISASVSP
jgi:hypothetical protein